MKLTLQFVGGSLDNHHVTGVDWPSIPFEQRHNDLIKSTPSISLSNPKPAALKPLVREVYGLESYHSNVVVDPIENCLGDQTEGDSSSDGVATYRFLRDEPIEQWHSPINKLEHDGEFTATRQNLPHDSLRSLKDHARARRDQCLGIAAQHGPDSAAHTAHADALQWIIDSIDDMPDALSSVDQYWLDHYTTTGVCDICANSGVIEPLGPPLGETYCFCPNGRKMRELKAPI